MNISHQLASIAEEIPEKKMVVQIYISLPSEYDSLIKDIKYRSHKQQTLINIIKTLMEEENSKNNKLITNNHSSLLISRSALIVYNMKIVEDAEIPEIDRVNMVLTKELIIPEAVAIAIVVGKFRNQIIKAIETIGYVVT
jgi:hypothetical protein